MVAHGGKVLAEVLDRMRGRQGRLVEGRQRLGKLLMQVAKRGEQLVLPAI